MSTHKLMGTIIGAAALSLAAAAPILAATGGPSGTIDMLTADASAVSAMSAPQSSYGASVQFRASVSGRLASQSTVYVTVVCFQNGGVVYANSGATDGSYLLADQLGDGLNWDGGAADCEGRLMYRVQKGKSFEFTQLDTEYFHVDAQI